MSIRINKRKCTTTTKIKSLGGYPTKQYTTICLSKGAEPIIKFKRLCLMPVEEFKPNKGSIVVKRFKDHVLVFDLFITRFSTLSESMELLTNQNKYA